MMKTILIPTNIDVMSALTLRSSAWLCSLWLCLALVLFAAPTPAATPQAATNQNQEKKQEKNMKPLTVEEARIILEKATERPFTGKYLNNKAAGTYVCRQCGTALYRSGDKFDSGCGWPSFDDAIEGAVKRVPDADGMRVEIVCAQCGGHLGHVFEGERFTPKNTRHCVNSVSMLFEPEAAPAAPGPAAPAANPAPNPAPNPVNPAPTATAYFAGGCFWGVEDEFSKVTGVLDAMSGYMNGKTENPTYEQVCSGTTDHAEAVRIIYDPAIVDYEQLAKLFFEIHDPTQLNRQGPDMGTQYRSAVFYENDAQKLAAEKLIEQLREKGWKVVTEVTKAATFYPAEAYHQDFTQRTGRGACHMRVARFTRGPRLWE